MIKPDCNDCRCTVRGCPAHREIDRPLASEILREMLERDAPEDEEQEDDDSTG